MRQWKAKYAVVASVLGLASGCYSMPSQEGTEETVAANGEAGPNDQALPVGCAPANRDPAESYHSMGHPNYVMPGCEGVTTASEDVVVDDEDVATGAEALPPLAEVPAEPEAQNDDIVEGEGGTPCGLTVIALSTAAVGDPCMTTEGVIEALELEETQRDAALAGVSDARTMFGDAAIAH